MVGLFVLLGFVLISVFAYWMLRPSDEMEMKKYVIYFNESVLGLNLDAPVKYRGITVGKVVKLGINPKNTEQVRVVISVNKDTPIKTSTVAKLTAQGITGLTYINLSLGDKNSPLLMEVPPGEKYPVIKTVPSFFETFQTSIGSLYNKLSHTLNNIDQALDEQNRAEFARLLHESATFFAKLNQTLDDKTIANIHKSVDNVQNITAQLDQSMPKLDALLLKSIEWEEETKRSFEQVVESYKKFEQASNAVEESFKRGDFDFKSISNEVIPSLTKSLNSLNGALNELRSTLNEYKKSPRDIFFKETEVKKGPGE